jgi:Fic family protein
VGRFEPRFTITNAITAALTAIERARGFLDAAVLSAEWLRSMSARALLLEAHHTTHIEGTHLTIDQAERLWAGEEVRSARSDDVRELLNYRQAFSLVSEYLNSGQPVTEALIREIHRRLVEGVRGGQADPGAYRKIQNYIANSQTREIIYTPPPPEEVPPLMRELVEWLRSETAIHPVLTAGIAQFHLVHIHPLVDGNGRTSRLLSTLHLYRTGYDFKRLFTLSEYYDRDRVAFYHALQSVRENDLDMSAWLEYFVTGLATQLTEVRSLGEASIRRDILVEEHQLNARQGLAIEHLLMSGTLDIRQFESLCPSVSRRTLERDLVGLERKGLVSREGGTNRLAYRLKDRSERWT